MRPKTLLVCGLVAIARAQAPPGDLLVQVTKRVLDTVERLPRYMCTQTIDRFQYEPSPRLTAPGCDLAPHLTFLATSDRLRLDVAKSAAREMYSWVGESRFEDRTLFDLITTGAVSTGSFSSFLSVVFETDNAAFTYKGPVTEGGRQLQEFEFHVPKAMSHYVYAAGGSRVFIGYFGAIQVDPRTADLVRLEVHSDGLPPETGSCKTSSILDYTRIRLNDTDFLLPRRTELNILDDNGVESRNTTVFSNCHEFLGESRLSFDSAPDPAGANPVQPAASDGGLPAGIPFEIELTQRIDPASAAAGDKVSARLAEPMRDRNRRILAPKGAPVTLRILEIRRYYERVPALRLVLKPQAIEINGAARALAASPDTRPKVPATPRRRFDTAGQPLVQLYNRDARAAVVQFLDIGPRFEVPGDFQSSWFTVALKP